MAGRSANGMANVRLQAAERFKPDRIRLLLIAEAPPTATDRYFYLPDVQTQDSLFRYVVRLVLRREPTRWNKAAFLAALRDAGVFLIDLCPNPVVHRSGLKECVPDLVERATDLRPDHIILIKATVYDLALEPLRQAGLPVLDVMIPFPGSGQQRRFEREMQFALDLVGWKAP